MIIATYFSRVKEIPQGYTKLFIARYAPKSLERYGVEHCPKLAPSPGLLSDYKDGKINFGEFKNNFRVEMDRNPIRTKILEIMTRNEHGENIALICYEKNEQECHRTILLDYFKIKGIECKELD